MIFVIKLKVLQLAFLMPTMQLIVFTNQSVIGFKRPVNCTGSPPDNFLNQPSCTLLQTFQNIKAWLKQLFKLKVKYIVCIKVNLI